MDQLINQSLNSNWIFQKKEGNEWLNAIVPGCVHLDLLNNNQIPDPFFGTNEKKIQWVSDVDWIYKLSFYPDKKLLDRDKIVLIFHGLDTYAKVYLNSNKILDTNNMFHPWAVEVQDILKVNENELLVYFYSPINSVLPALKRKDYILPADNDKIKNTSPYTRKAPYHYGWDWGPSFATSGIWKSVELIGYDNWRVKSIHIHQEKVTKQKADLIIKVDIESFIDSDAVLTISELSKGINTSESIFLSKGLNIINKKMFINDPDLWWPIGHGGQNLYDFNIVFETKGYNQTIRKRVGLRDFRVDQKIDHAGTGFTFVINGKPIYSKGANWIPADFFTTRLKKEDYYRLLKSAVSANMNTLRVWGGGIYESEHFYNICDEMGILVWQDFMFSCALYPGDKEFLKSVEKEARFQVSRLKDHPSIILWCGNNEIAWAWHNWGWKDKYPKDVFEQDYNNLFHKILPRVCKELDPCRFYWPSSPGDDDSLPLRGQNYGKGDNHFWEVWHGGKDFQAFEDNIGRFMSEFGMQSFPDLKTVASFCDSKENYLESDTIKAHQKASLGNRNVKKYIDMYFPTPKDFDSFVVLSQIMAGEAIKKAVESQRRSMPYCMGSLYWQLNDCWPVASWSSLDYYGNWKALHYFAKDFFNPIIISITEIEREISFFIVCDKNDIKKAELLIELFNFSGKLKYSEKIVFNVPSNSSAKVFSMNKSLMLKSTNPDEVILRSAVIIKKKKIFSSDYIFAKPKELKLPKQDFRCSYKKNQDEYIITIKAESFLYRFYLHCTNDSGVFSKNYFNMLPGEIVKINYLPSKIFNKSNNNEEPQFKYNSIFGLVNK